MTKEKRMKLKKEKRNRLKREKMKKQNKKISIRKIIPNTVENGVGVLIGRNSKTGGKIVYTGEIKNGLPNGNGTTQTEEMKYVGGHKDGKSNGKGTHTETDGIKLVGDWKVGNPVKITMYKNEKITGKHFWIEEKDDEFKTFTEELSKMGKEKNKNKDIISLNK